MIDELRKWAWMKRRQNGKLIRTGFTEPQIGPQRKNVCLSWQVKGTFADSREAKKISQEHTTCIKSIGNC